MFGNDVFVRLFRIALTLFADWRLALLLSCNERRSLFARSTFT
jgi:hypothetical protein